KRSINCRAAITATTCEWLATKAQPLVQSQSAEAFWVHTGSPQFLQLIVDTESPRRVIITIIRYMRCCFSMQDASSSQDRSSGFRFSRVHHRDCGVGVVPWVPVPDELLCHGHDPISEIGRASCRERV